MVQTTVRDVAWPSVDWSDGWITVIPFDMMPYVIGALEMYHYRAVYDTDDDHDNALQDILQYELNLRRLGTVSEMVTALELINTTLQCLCDAGTVPNAFYPGTLLPSDGQEDYDDYMSIVEEGVGDPPETTENWVTWVADVCIGAQRWVEDWANAIRDIGAVLAVGIAGSFTIINGVLAVTVIGIPVAIVIEVIGILSAFGAAYLYDNVADWIDDNYSDLVCAIVTGPTPEAAKENVLEYIDDNYDLPQSDLLIKALVTNRGISAIYDITLKDFDVWESNYDAMYCEVCEEEEESEQTWTFPPCPGDWVGTPTCYDGRIALNESLTATSPDFELDTPGDYDIQFVNKWYSVKPIAWTVGWVRLSWWNGSSWQPIHNHALTNTAGAGVLNETDETLQCESLSAGDYHLYTYGQAGQSETEPYPVEFTHVQVEFNDPTGCP